MPAPRKSPPPPPPRVEENASTPNDAGAGEAAPELEKRRRTPKNAKLQEAVGGLYILLGGGISTLPEQFVPMQVKLVGMSLATSHEEIAEAWIDLAEDDPKVRKAIESLTSFSGWGKVIGVHLIAVGASVPGIAAVMPQQPAAQQQPQQPGNGAPSMEDMQAIMALGDLLRQAQTQQRGEAVPPMQQQQAPPPQQAPIMQEPRLRAEGPPPPQPQQSVRPRAGMPSPADMGVSIPDAPVDFPSSGAESIRG